MSKEYLDVLDRMETDLVAVDKGPALASIAISLKRIADALEKSNGPLNHYGEGIGEAIQMQIIRGLRGIDQ